MSDYPEIRRGTRWEQTQARQWKNLTDDVRAPANIQAGPGIILNRVGGHLNVGVIPPILRLLTTKLPRPKGGTGASEKFSVETANPGATYAQQADYFYATQLSTGEEHIKIAKPWMLRRSTSENTVRLLNEFRVVVQYEFDRNGVIHNRRTVTLVEHQHIRHIQMIWEEYAANNIVNAQQLGEEGTQVEGVEWEDMNETGRVWSVLPLGFLP